MKDLSTRTLNIAASLTVAIDTLAKQMIADGKDVVSLGAGEPDFPTPTPIQDAACKAIREGKTRYTAPVGILEVRKAVAEKLKVENGLNYKPEQIIMTSGAKHAVFNSLAALVNEGDEVIIPAPYWVTYPELVKWLGGKPVIVNTKIEDGFKIKPEALKAAITAKTKAILLNNPCNPTGAVYSKAELEALAKVLSTKSIEFGQPIYLISDEPYREIAYGVEVPWVPDIYDRTIVCYSYSKSLSLPGERIGWVLVPGTNPEHDVLVPAVAGAGRKMGFVCAPALFQRVRQFFQVEGNGGGGDPKPFSQAFDIHIFHRQRFQDLQP